MKVSNYVEECCRDAKGNAAVPVSIAAEFLGLTREAVAERIRGGSLEAITISGRERSWKLVRVSSLLEGLHQEVTLVRPVTRTLEKHAPNLITYGTLMEAVGLDYRNPRHRKLIGSVLGVISETSLNDPRKGFMMSALAVSKGDGRPNQAFFDLATRIGRLGRADDREKFWQDEIRHIKRYYASAKPK